MDNIVYGVIEEKYTLGKEQRVSYGIAAYSDSNINGTATVVKSVRDISNDISVVTEITDICNRLSLSTIHLHEVINDYLER